MSQINNYSRYFIRDGNIYRKANDKQKKEMKLAHRISNGFIMYTLTNDKNKAQSVYLHRILAEVYCKKPKQKGQFFVVHIDGNKLNNDITNLKWVSCKEFRQEEYTSGQRSAIKSWETRVARYGLSGGLKPFRRTVNLTNEELENIFSLYNIGCSYREISTQFNCSASYIYKLIQNHKHTNKEKS